MKLWLDPTISKKTWKALQKELPKDSGPTPEHGDDVLYEMLQERSVNMFLDTKAPDDPLVVTLENIPEGARMITNPK